MKKLIPVLCLALAACLPEATPKSEFPNGWTDADERDCLGAGGRLTGGLAGPACATPTPDAGRPCRDGSECSAGICMADGAQCARETTVFGCVTILEDGQTQALCID